MKCEVIYDHFQNFRSYVLPKTQLIIADIPYNIIVFCSFEQIPDVGQTRRFGSSSFP